MKIPSIYSVAFLLLYSFLSLFTEAQAGGAGGSWGCPSGWVEKADGSCSFDGNGGGSSGGGSGGSWDGMCTTTGWTKNNVDFYATLPALCVVFAATKNQNYISSYVSGTDPNIGVCITEFKSSGNPDQWIMNKKGDCLAPEVPEPEKPEPPVFPDFPDLPPPPPDCNPCQQLYEIQLKINQLKNYDIKNINQTIFDMSQVINNIDNSINDLSVNQEITNNNLTMIDNSIGDLITNIENNNITQNEIKNEVNNIKNVMNDYSLQLGDIKLAMGDIDLSLKNTNKLVLDLGLDLDFIKNKLVNGGGDSKDYTPYLNRIIELLEPCEPTEEEPCEPTDEEQTQIDLLDVLVSLDNFIKEEFEPSDEDTEVPVTDLTDINLDRNLINFGAAQCPPDNEFSTMVNGFAFSGGFKHQPLCDFFTMLAPFVKAFGGFSAALILGGGLRR